MSVSVLVNGRVLGDDGLVEGLAVVVDGERIASLLPAHEASVGGARRHDLGGGILAPGFIDCQVNGGGGVLFNDSPSVDSIRRISAAHRRFGTTAMLPTLITDSSATMRAAIAAVDSAVREGVPGILGIHLEGPFLATGRRGIHDASKFRAPDATDIELVSSLRHGTTLLTLAPECVEAGFVAALAARGVIVCAGHTAAGYDRTRAALDAGLRGFTHLFNAMTPLGSREPGVVGAALADPDSWCGVIVDGHHVHPAALRVALAAKPRGKLMLVTDAMPPVGASTDKFELNGETIRCHDGICTNSAGVLAGSALDMAGAVRNTVSLLHVPLDEALRMASTYPAQFLGLSHSHGRIAPGYRADLVLLDDNLAVGATWIAGNPA